MNRRHALALIAAFPFAARLDALTETRGTAKTRVVVGLGHGFLFEPGGTLRSWRIEEVPDDLAPPWLGLGHNRVHPAFTLDTVQGLTNVVAAAAGHECSYAVLGDGRLMSWGLNAGNGRLGTTTRDAFERTATWGPNANTPIPVVTKFDAVDVSCVKEHVVALARDGAVYTWGQSDKGKLGVGRLPAFNFQRYESAASTYMPFPVRVPDLSEITSIKTGYAHSLALRSDGTVQAWGDNYRGQLGDGTTTDRDRPVVVQHVRNAIAIAASGDISGAVLADGTVMTWGADPADNPVTVPVLAPGVGGVRSIAAGVLHFAVVTDAGTVLTWGDNRYSALGRGENPRGAGLVSGVSGVQSISACARTTTAVLASGKIMTWGGVRPWTRPNSQATGLSPFPILLWLDGLEQPQ